MNVGQDLLILPSISLPSSAVNLHTLPIELLAHIFLFCTEVLKDPSLPYPPWLPITYVCRHWRTVALTHAKLWTSIDPGFSSQWIKVFMERSRTMLMDFDLHVAPFHVHRSKDAFFHSHEDIIQLLSDFTRLRSLHLKGIHNTIFPILDSLCHPLPVQNLSLFIPESYGAINRVERAIWSISDGLFGGSAPIRHLHLTVNGRIIMPHSFLHGVTHFTTNELITPSELCDILPQMPTLTYLEIHCPRYLWMDKLCLLPIQMPCLTNLITHTSNNPTSFMELNKLLLLNAGVKRRVEVQLLAFDRWCDPSHWTSTGMSTLINAVGGFQHIHFSGSSLAKGGWLRMWTGCFTTTWEDAEFCLVTQWKDSGGYKYGDLRTPFIALGVTQVRRLIIDFPHVNVWKYKPRDLSDAYWWEILPEIEELELYYTGIGQGGFWRHVWELRTAPAVLPALRRVRIGAKLHHATHHYAIIGDLPTRKIVSLSDSTNSVVAFSEAESAEKELEDLSSGLLKFLQGLAGCKQCDWYYEY